MDEAEISRKAISFGLVKTLGITSVKLLFIRLTLYPIDVIERLTAKMIAKENAATEKLKVADMNRCTVVAFSFRLSTTCI